MSLKLKTLITFDVKHKEALYLKPKECRLKENKSCIPFPPETLF